MNTLFLNVIDQMNCTDHMQQLLKKYQLSINILCENQLYSMTVREGELKLSPTDLETSDVVIEGGEQEISRWVQGEDFLLAMIRRGELSAQGRLKYLLWLESLFYLSRSVPLSQ